MPFDFKKEYKEFYLPPRKPTAVEIPAMNFAAVRGKGDPNDPNGDYRRALDVLYSVAYTLLSVRRTPSRRFLVQYRRQGRRPFEEREVRVAFGDSASRLYPP